MAETTDHAAMLSHAMKTTTQWYDGRDDRSRGDVVTRDEDDHTEWYDGSNDRSRGNDVTRDEDAPHRVVRWQRRQITQR